MNENFNHQELLQIYRAMLSFDMRTKDERYKEFNHNILEKLRVLAFGHE